MSIAACNLRILEGCKLAAYWDRLGNCWTVGYGQVVSKPCTISQVEAEWLLQKYLTGEAKELRTTGLEWLNDNQWAAILCFAYNAGADAFNKSHLRKLLVTLGSSGVLDMIGKARVHVAWKQWRLAGGVVVQGLLNRRNAELELFFKGV